MSRRRRLEDGEALVISVTPVPRGLLAPAALLVLLDGGVVWLAMHWRFLHRYEPVALIAVGLLPALVLATRSWRWRSHKITLTTQRIISEGGVLGRYSTEIYLGDVITARADQSFTERMRRRGMLTLETTSGTVVLGPLRHPMALRRLVDRCRRDLARHESRSWEEWFDDPSDGHDDGGDRRRRRR
ncbi:MAG: PH domain-containing protein [Acidobacteriota bacterium]|nr:PH domain-containing protein [Acidobacteriota bacterium]MDE3031887.1 PH domain-containing protein [Acidobacteriota bacterium]MDE3094007.1 PH domain-containing protein [Acidobacteriota bacterium]